jgi:hypothetical protein
MNDPVTKPYSRKNVLSALLGSGKCRALHFLDQSTEVQGKELHALCSEICKREQATFFSIVDAKKVRTAQDWCSQFARNLRTGNGAKPIELAKFALGVGKSLISFDQKQEGHADVSAYIAQALTTHFSNLVNGSPKMLIAVRGLDELNEEILSWFAKELNQSLRDENAFKNARFLFSSRKEDERIATFFNQFGFENVRRFSVPQEDASSVNQCPKDQFTQISAVENFSTVDAKESKRLINEETQPRFKEGNILKVSDNQQDVQDLLASFSEVEQKYLCLLSYSSRASRYSLEHFTDSRNAALCYNWFKRQPGLHLIHPSGDLLLKENIKEAARVYHKSLDAEQAATWEEIGSVLDLFFERFPYADDHSVAINLQAFSSFDFKLLRNLFNTNELSAIELFIIRNEEQIIQNDKTFVLSDDAKLVTRRYMEISDRSPLSGLLDRVREIWLKDQEKYSYKKHHLDQEKKNLSAELEDTLAQIVQLKELKDKLLDEFKNPKRFKSEKSYTFTTSKALVLLGLVTCGASIFFETLGTYHAACGLALTLFGFFWPNVELKKATAGSDGPRSNLAIETQQRSLKHRITGLGNRTGVMKSNLDEVEEQIAKLGESPPSPYLELKE